MKILITGGAGFIGSHLCGRLLRDSHDVVCLDNFYTGKRKNIEPLLKSPNFKLHECTVRDFRKLKEAFKKEKPELVYHLAVVVGVKRTLESPEEVLETNIQGTVNVLNAGLESGTSKVVNISSSEVYGDPVEVPEREDSPKNVSLPYALSKLVAEEYAQIFYQKHGLATVSLRLFNAYGPGQDCSPYGFVVGVFINRVLRKEPPVIFGDGFQTRDFTYIDDVIEPIVLAAKSNTVNGGAINIAAGKPVIILDLAELVIELCGEKLEPIFAPERPFEIKHRFADISKMRTVLGYKPKYDLKEGLKLTIDWYRKSLGLNR